MDQTSTDIRLLPVSRLRVDHSYQRKLDEAWMRRLYDTWQPALAGVLIVSSRKDGELVVLDGQHRLATIRSLLADHDERATESAWCEVYFGLGVEEEAAIFLGRNAQKPVHKLDQFKARVKAGETTATTIDTILKANGTQVDFNRAMGYACVTVLEKMLTWQVLDSTINLLETTWPDDRISIGDRHIKRARQMVEGTGIFLRTFVDHDDFDPAVAVRRWAERINLVRMLEDARNKARSTSVNQSMTVARTLRDAYNIHAKRRLPEVVPPKGFRA